MGRQAWIRASAARRGCALRSPFFVLAVQTADRQGRGNTVVKTDIMSRVRAGAAGSRGGVIPLFDRGIVSGDVAARVWALAGAKRPASRFPEAAASAQWDASLFVGASVSAQWDASLFAEAAVFAKWDVSLFAEAAAFAQWDASHLAEAAVSGERDASLLKRDACRGAQNPPFWLENAVFAHAPALLGFQ